jgi:FkbM family methyltransferase
MGWRSMAMQLFKRLLSALVILGIATGLVYALSPKFRLFALVVSGRSPVCPLRLAVDTQGHLDILKTIHDRILSASHLVTEKDGLELWDTPKGQYWIPKGNRYVLPFNLAEMESHIYGSGEHFVKAGDIVLDCGASDGDFSHEALNAGAKLVVAIEISPASVECLRRNLATEIAQGRAIVYPKGVWDKDDILPLNVADNNFAANSVVLHAPGAHATFQAQLTTIDKIVGELALPRVDFIKMDIEGAEVKALNGARETLRRFRPRLAIATEHKPDDEVAIPNAVRAVRADYQAECGYCAQSNGHIRPEAMYFY